MQSPCVVTSETETFYQQSCIVRGGKNAVGVRGRRVPPMPSNDHKEFTTQFSDISRRPNDVTNYRSIFYFTIFCNTKIEIFKETDTVHFVSSDFKSRIATM